LAKIFMVMMYVIQVHMITAIFGRLAKSVYILRSEIVRLDLHERNLGS